MKLLAELRGGQIHICFSIFKRAITKCTCAKGLQHEPVHRQIQLQLLAQAAYFGLGQLNSAARLSLIIVRLSYIYRPNSDFFIYNQSTGAVLERPSYSLQFKLTRDFTF
jgi:hypothetical protein